MTELVSIARLQTYLAGADLSQVPGWQAGQPFELVPLAQGEYNLNYLLCQGSARQTGGSQRWVLRLNTGTQIGRADQAAYEYRALQWLASSGVTPRPYYLDDRRTGLEYGLLIMEYLPGQALDYHRDLPDAARLFARLHSLDLSLADNPLMVEERPLSGMVAECQRLAQVYLQSELADPALCGYLEQVLAWANQARTAEAYFLADPCPRAINTEVNSGNFIANRPAGTLHLVDWEKPLWGDPSQDLSHFSVPTTTLWKTDYRMPAADRRTFLDTYARSLADAHLADTMYERVRLRDPFNCLRGITWSAMAWVQYQTGGHTLRNPDTFRKLEQYLQLDFLRSLFDPYLG